MNLSTNHIFLRHVSIASDLEFEYEQSMISMIVYIVGMIGIVIRSDYGFVFKPLPLHTVLAKEGLSQYMALAIPGMFQNAFEWIIQEVATILAGYVVNSTIALVHLLSISL